MPVSKGLMEKEKPIKGNRVLQDHKGQGSKYSFWEEVEKESAKHSQDRSPVRGGLKITRYSQAAVGLGRHSLEQSKEGGQGRPKQAEKD